MSERRFLDTNVLVYLYDQDEPRKQERAREILAESPRGSLVLSTQVLQEFFVAVTRKIAVPLPNEEALAALDDLSAFPVSAVDKKTVTAAATLSVDHQVSLWDALILTAASAAGCDKVLTEDLQDGWQVLGVQVENPFRDLS